MNKTVIVSLVILGLLFIAGCSESTSSVPRGSAAPSGAVPVGGGCGVAAPAPAAAEPVADARIAL
jgi:hypothetical protein